MGKHPLQDIPQSAVFTLLSLTLGDFSSAPFPSPLSIPSLPFVPASLADLIVPETRRIAMGDRAFAVAAPRAWNSLPDAIHRSPSLATFKRSLKTHFYIQCFY